jgi:L,D-peptidoglycan transpeptidase YkuD (ErfK/YbiS/YcfS/YnhG family)
MDLWERQSGGWAHVAGPWRADVGEAGWAFAPGEATGRSPIGSFTFGTGFGLAPDPGYRLGWFAVGPTDYWVEDPASPDYNTHQLGPADESRAPWTHFERLADQPVAYAYAALIDFNVPVTGSARGSGIFLHVTKGHATAGCVSLPTSQLLVALRWIDASTRIIMGPDSVIRQL